MKEYTKEQKKILLLHHKVEHLRGYCVRCPPCDEEYDCIIVCEEDFEQAKREGINDYFTFSVEGPYRDIDDTFNDFAEELEQYVETEREFENDEEIELYFDAILNERKN